MMSPKKRGSQKGYRIVFQDSTLDAKMTVEENLNTIAAFISPDK